MASAPIFCATSYLVRLDGSDGHDLLVFDLSQVALRSWRSTKSVLSKLPYGYDSVTRQSLSSTEDDMGIYTLHLIYQIL